MPIVPTSNERSDRKTKNFLITGSRIVLRLVESTLSAFGGDWMLVVLSHHGRESRIHGKNNPLGSGRQGNRSYRTYRTYKAYSDELVIALERAFQMRGRVAHDWPRCCGLKPNRIMRPFPTPTSARAIWPRSLSSPRSQPLSSTFSFA